MLLEDVLHEFMLELELQNYSIRTIKSYRNNNLLLFTYFKQEFGLENIEQIKSIHLKSYNIVKGLSNRDSPFLLPKFKKRVIYKLKEYVDKYRIILGGGG